MDEAEAEEKEETVDGKQRTVPAHTKRGKNGCSLQSMILLGLGGYFAQPAKKTNGTMLNTTQLALYLIKQARML